MAILTLTEEITALPDVPMKNLKYQEYISPFMESLNENRFQGEECYIYRTVQDIPLTEEDEMPQQFRERNVGRRIPRKFTQEEADAKTPRQKQKILGTFGLSVNDTCEAAVKSAVDTYHRLKDKGVSTEDLAAYIAQRGHYVARFRYTQELGILTNFEGNHANLYEYEGKSLEESRDFGYKPVEIDYEDKRDED